MRKCCILCNSLTKQAVSILYLAAVILLNILASHSCTFGIRMSNCKFKNSLPLCLVAIPDAVQECDATEDQKSYIAGFKKK